MLYKYFNAITFSCHLAIVLILLWIGSNGIHKDKSESTEPTPSRSMQGSATTTKLGTAATNSTNDTGVSSSTSQPAATSSSSVNNTDKSTIQYVATPSTPPSNNGSPSTHIPDKPFSDRKKKGNSGTLFAEKTPDYESDKPIPGKTGDSALDKFKMDVQKDQEAITTGMVNIKIKGCTGNTKVVIDGDKEKTFPSTNIITLTLTQGTHILHFTTTQGTLEKDDYPVDVKIGLTKYIDVKCNNAAAKPVIKPL